MGRNVVAGVFALILLGTSATGVYGQDEVLGELYGRGVHSYFAEDYKEAFSFLSEAIKEGSRDPRCFYFRGLTFIKLGRPESSDEEFAAGAKLEASSEDLYPVSRSLQRVQGKARLSIEKHRRNARVESRRIEEARRVARYQAMLEAEKEVLRKPAGRSPAVPLSSGSDPTDPFSKNNVPMPPKPAVGDNSIPVPPKATPPLPKVGPIPPKPPTEPAANDPFGNAPKPAPKGKPADDPFGAAPPKPPTKGSVGKSLFKALGSAIPGGESDKKPASDDPFGAKPAPNKKPAAADDPFGAKSAPPKKPAPAADDPFGTKPAPAKKPAATADDDPFK